MPLLEVRNLHTFFTTKKGIVKAVNDVSYSLEAGKTIGIVGESGSGKSVSAMSILQLLDGNGYIESGEILLEGRDLTKLSTKEISEIRGLKKAIRNHDVIGYLCNGADPVPVKKEVRKNADDGRTAGNKDAA